MVTIKVQNLINFVAEVFAHADSSPEEARRIATYLTTANLTAHDSHGVIRVPVYIRWKKLGSVAPDQTIEFVVDTPALAAAAKAGVRSEAKTNPAIISRRLIESPPRPRGRPSRRIMGPRTGCIAKLPTAYQWHLGSLSPTRT